MSHSLLGCNYSTPKSDRDRFAYILQYHHNYTTIYLYVIGDSSTEVEDNVFGKMAEKDLIILLSTSANIVSRHTAFVGVDKVWLIFLDK